MVDMFTAHCYFLIISLPCPPFLRVPCVRHFPASAFSTGRIKRHKKSAWHSVPGTPHLQMLMRYLICCIPALTKISSLNIQCMVCSAGVIFNYCIRGNTTITAYCRVTMRTGRISECICCLITVSI